MKVIIVSDGTFSGTHITDEQGRDIPATGLSVYLNGGLVMADITTLMPQLTVNAEAQVTAVCPYCGRPE